MNFIIPITTSTPGQNGFICFFTYSLTSQIILKKILASYHFISKYSITKGNVAVSYSDRPSWNSLPNVMPVRDGPQKVHGDSGEPVQALGKF